MSTDINIYDKEKFKTKVINILCNYNKNRSKIKVLVDYKNYLIKLSNSNDRIIAERYISKSKSSGAYSNNTEVEAAVLRNEYTEANVKRKRIEIREEIENLESIIAHKETLLKIIDDILHDMNPSDQELIKLVYIDKEKNKDTWNDILQKYNSVKKRGYAVTTQTLRNWIDGIVKNIVDALSDIRMAISYIVLYEIEG